jgi:lipopolysaccharide/colanic/teichoic acid biosynthesis glycosyltransferase
MASAFLGGSNLEPSLSRGREPALADVPACDPLSPHEFLALLRREKRRAERSGAALSLLLYRTDPSILPPGAQADRLVDLLHSAKRETDVVAQIDERMLAMVCPDTDERGAACVIAKIRGRAAELRYSVQATTYPDDIVHAFTQAKADSDATPSRPPDPAPATPGGDAANAQAISRAPGSYPLKRALDIAGALVALVLLGPLMLLVALAVALSSPGPVIFRQTRVGQGAQPFAFYKFRSMRVGVGDEVHRQFVARLIEPGHAAEGTGATPIYKLRHDPRVTPIGRLIRKTSLDELPQLFNVLKGDMSLVGPRPPIPYEMTHYQPWHLRRILSVKPGITGLWQVDGRSRVGFNDMVRMDLRYIRDCSLALDLKILLKTVWVVVRCEGAV